MFVIMHFFFSKMPEGIFTCTEIYSKVKIYQQKICLKRYF